MPTPGGPAAAPTRDDRVVAGLSGVVGGPLGDHAGQHRWWTPTRVVLAVTAVCFALGMVQKAPCYVDTWGDPDRRYAAMCYSDLPYLYTGRGFAELAWPYSDDARTRERYPVMEYPVGIAYAAWGVAGLTHAVTGWPDTEQRAARPADALPGEAAVQREVRAFVILHALLFALCALAAAWLLARTHRRRPWDAMGFAAAPVLALTALVNWDLLAVVLVAAALWAWSRDRPGLTGLLIGVGAATKLYPLLLLGGVVVICWRRRRWGDLALASVAAALAWAALNLPAYVLNAGAWGAFWRFNAERGPDLGSLWLVASQAGDVTIAPGTVNVTSWVVLGVWCAGVLVLGLRAPETPRLAQLGLLVVAGFLLVNKVYSPQYVLWLLPLAVLARPRWRDLIVWQSAEVFYFASVWWYLGDDLAPAGGGDAGFYWLAITVRVAGQLWLVGVVARDVLRPAHDPVREGRAVGDDGPLVRSGRRIS